MPLLFSLIESPTHPDFNALYKQLGLQHQVFTSSRKAISALKKNQPDIFVADFFYGYGNNYAGVNVSNLDVFLYSLQKYKKDTRVIILVQPSEQQYVERLEQLFSISAALPQPVTEATMKDALLNTGLIRP